MTTARLQSPLFHALSMTDPIVKRIVSFRRLEHGWNYGSGRPSPRHVIDAALTVHAQLKAIGAEQTEAFPAISGGMMVSGYYRAETVDIMCRMDGYFDVFHKGPDQVYTDVESVGLSFVRSYIQELKWRPHSFSDFSTPNTSVTKRTGSRVWHSRNRMMAVPSSTVPVQSKRVTANARTFGHFTTPELLASLPYFSASTSDLYHQVTP
jgi:hypothetical protein